MPDQTHREQLATAILDAMRDSVGEYDTPFIDGSSLEWACLDGRVDMLAAVDTLLAAGWRPPARVIEDPAELDALPAGSVVMMTTWMRRAFVYAGGGRWWVAGPIRSEISAAEVLDGCAVEVLHTLENGDTQ